MDSGFNVISMNNGADYMNGNIPPSFPSSMNVTYNYWGETPVQEKFEVTGGEVIYEPYLNQPGTPPTDYYDLYDIGFGLYDTVYSENLGDNINAEKLFI